MWEWFWEPIWLLIEALLWWLIRFTRRRYCWRKVGIGIGLSTWVLRIIPWLHKMVWELEPPGDKILDFCFLMLSTRSFYILNYVALVLMFLICEMGIWEFWWVIHHCLCFFLWEWELVLDFIGAYNFFWFFWDWFDEFQIWDHL